MHHFRKVAGAQVPREFESPPLRKNTKLQSGEKIRPSQTTCGGRRDIPLQTSPVAPSAFLLTLLAISRIRVKGARGEQMRVRLWTRWVLTSFYFSFLNANTMFEAAHFRFYGVCGTPYAHIRTAPALPTVANRNRGARPPYRYVLA